MRAIGKQWRILALFVGVFLAFYFVPLESARLDNAVGESLRLARDYARQHVLLCLVPAFFIAGAIGTFLSQGAVMKYLGAGANKALAYGVASVSGTILAVCSCTVLPLFAGIYRMGAGLGPATTFLYSGPAINVLAIILTASVLGMELGIARAVGAVVFSVVIGLAMHLIYRKQERVKAEGWADTPQPQEPRPLWKTAACFGSMVGILVFANWGNPAGSAVLWELVYSLKWILSGIFAAALAGMILAWFKRAELADWTAASWGFARQILPLLLAGVLVAGLLLGRPGHEGMIPSRWIASAVGGNSIRANLAAAVAGALMYFATLTEVPILQGLLGAGMGKGPALALLLAGPALSLPNMLVIRSVLGTQKTVVYVLLVITMATISGLVFGACF